MMTLGKSKVMKRLVTQALFDAGYVHLGEGVHKAALGSLDVEHFIYILDDLKREYVISGEIGIRNDSAEVFSCNAIRRYGGLLFQQFKCGEPCSCMMRVYFEGLDNSGWPVHLHDIAEEPLRDFLQDFFARRVASTIGLVKDLEKFLEFLVADEPYFPWPGSNAAIRAAQVVAVAREIGLSADFIHAMLEPRMRLIAAGLSKTSEMRANPKAYVDRILEDWELQ